MDIKIYKQGDDFCIINDSVGSCIRVIDISDGSNDIELYLNDHQMKELKLQLERFIEK